MPQPSVSDGWQYHVPVDGLGDVDGLVAHGVADLLEGHAVTVHDRHRRMPSFMSVPVADAGPLGHLAEPPVERIPGVYAPVLVAEHEVVVLPRGAAASRSAAWHLIRVVFRDLHDHRGVPVLTTGQLNSAANIPDKPEHAGALLPTPAEPVRLYDLD